jgi:hypothetical protein
MTALLLAAVLAAPPAAADAAGVLKALETAGRALKTMKASFVETKVLVLLDEKQETRGDVLLQVPGRLRWNYTDPQPSAMVIKDGRFSRYIPKSKQVFRGQAKGEADLLVGFGPGPRAWAGSTKSPWWARRRWETNPPMCWTSSRGRSSPRRALLGDPPVGGQVAVDPRPDALDGAHRRPHHHPLHGVVLNGPVSASAFDLKLPSGVEEVQ